MSSARPSSHFAPSPSASMVDGNPSSTQGPGNTSTNTSTGSGSDSGTNYFFGFIVTFIVLLLLFVSCGFRSRRRSGSFAPSWARGLQADDTDNVFYGGPGGWLKPPAQPVFWEAWLHPLRQEARWGDLQPVSAALVRPLLPGGSSSRSQTPATSPPPDRLARENTNSDERPPQPAPSRSPLCSWVRAWLCEWRMQQPPQPPPPPKLAPPEAVQFAVVICMPSPLTSEYHDGKGEGPSSPICPPRDESIAWGYEIGLMQLPWTHGEIS
ncbi:hypothetical protein ID866_6647 [Astraeus odoratus]|nr:hypothetical protein ID866_6647 [Astraeus odoratus]